MAAIVSRTLVLVPLKEYNPVLMRRSRADRDTELLRAVAANHRWWFRERGEASCLVGADADAEVLVREARGRGAGGFGVWSMERDDALGVRLVARGFEWGWRPHWMGIDLDEDGAGAGDSAPESRFEVTAAEPPFAKTLSYRDELPLPDGAVHLGVRLREKIVGQAIVLPLDGVAGIYSMGVVPKVQGRGIGLALTHAALRAARERGCEAAVLNATDAGESLYARAGFRSLGWGGTWWYSPAPEPSERSVALMEAAGFGDVAALERLAPSEAEAGSPALVELAVVTGQVGSVEYLLTRFPALAALRFPPHGGNLLHVAVEHDRPEVIEAALRLGLDPEARDDLYGGTPAGWAEHLGRSYLR
jgi:GNAT superfamily N-acetyltransferase